MITSLHTRLAAGLAFGAVAMLLACSGVNEPELPDGASYGVVVSEPLLGQAAGTDGNATAASTYQEISYVSLPPGSFPAGETATITNLMSGGSRTEPMMNGGFDPVPIPAVVGDTVETTIRTDDGGLDFRMVNEVPLRVPPIIVRTDPEEGKVDVLLNVAPIVVFSEPMDGPSLTPETIQLLGPLPVDGVVTLSDDGLRGEFTPSGALAPFTTYTLVITTGVADGSGDQLESQVEVTFTTRRLLDPGPILFERFVVPRQRSEIWTNAPDGSNPVMMEEGTAPAWSPDGSKILFLNGSGVYVMNADGSGIVELTQDTGWRPVDLGYSWSPDGSKIVIDRSGGIYAMNADGTGAVKLTDERGSPTWSPDGSKISIVTEWSFNDNITAEIHVMNADGSAKVNLTNNPAQDAQVAWSPDGSKIAFVSDRDVEPWSGTNIYVMNADGSNLVRLRPRQPNEHGSDPAWSPDGSMIAFSQGHLGAQGEIYVINADGTAEVNLTNDPGPDRSPAWSPDGKQIVFSSYREAPVPGDKPLNIYVMNADGSDVRRITLENLALDWNPQWRR